MLATTISNIQPVDKKYLQIAQARLDSQAKPRGSLGTLEYLACRLVAIAQGKPPVIDPARIYTCAGDHGVAAQQVSLFPQEVTRQMVHNFLNQGAAINILAQTSHIDLKVVDTGCLGDPFPAHEHLLHLKIASGTKDFSHGPAMTKEQCKKALTNGVLLAQNAVNEGMRVLGTGEMGIANTTPATALFCAYLGLDPMEITGPGTGLAAADVNHKAHVIQKALDFHAQIVADQDPVDILATLGGFEIATLAGVILGSASLSIPVVIDGFISTSAYVAAKAICPQVQDYAFFAHVSAEPGFKKILAALGEKPLLDLGLRLGEGTGAALAIFLLRSAVNIYNDMATFTEAGVHDAK